MKQDFIERVSREIEQDFRAARLEPREALARTCRILAAEGHESGLAGQVTARAGKPGTLWALQFGYGGRPNPGVRFHVWICNAVPTSTP